MARCTNAKHKFWDVMISTWYVCILRQIAVVVTMASKSINTHSLLGTLQHAANCLWWCLTQVLLLYVTG